MNNASKIESIKTTSMEDVSTRVLEKIIKVFHVRWVININHKAKTTVSMHFCLARAGLDICEYLDTM